MAEETRKGKKVFVGLSGGVDSAVSAALLLRAGYEVTGVFIKVWQPEFVECTWKEDRLDAMRVAAFLGIPFMTLDLSKEYEQEVITRMKSDYAAGITPNPDVMCNRFIKFGAFRKWAIARGADCIATGHHARVREADGKFELLRGADPLKDQAYFLHQLTQEDLAHALFPIGHLTKKAVRAEAERLGLPVAKRPDSQGLCFVGAIDMHDFLQEILSVTPGPVFDESGKEIGRHDGAALYTLGQRHGFHVTEKEAAKVPQFVLAVRVKENTIIVGPDASRIKRREVPITDARWVSGEKPDTEGMYEAEARYHHTPVACTLAENEEGAFIVSLKEEVLAVPGQSLVVYDGEKCLGGGVIGA